MSEKQPGEGKGVVHQEEKAKEKEEEEETPDEWTVLADSYTKYLVPAFQPIYDAVAEDLLSKTNEIKSVLDFGCGPGEPTLTLANKISTLRSIVAMDSTTPMLEIAKKRQQQEGHDKNDVVTFHHVRRDVSMKELKDIAMANTNEPSLDAIVSAFVLMYVDFPRRVELVTTFLELSPQVLLLTWGPQSNVGFLRAIKIYGTWKGQCQKDDAKDICDIAIDEEDNGEVESPRGSFTLARKECFQGIVDAMEKGDDGGAELESFEIKSIDLKFPNVKALLSFLPMPNTDDDCQAMWKLLKNNLQPLQPKQVILGESLNDELSFPTDVVFCRIGRGTNKDSNKRQKC